METIFGRKLICSNNRPMQSKVLIGAKGGYTYSTKVGFKLLGYELSVEYKSGSTNKVVDALSQLTYANTKENISEVTS